ncbi:MAG: hypothetical protein ACTH9H_09270 [Galactobacter sp.]
MSTPSLASSLATSHGGGGAQVSSPSLTKMMERGPSPGSSSAAALSDAPMGVYP